MNFSWISDFKHTDLFGIQATKSTMAANDNDKIPESVQDSRWEAEFQPSPSSPVSIVNTQYAGLRVLRQEIWYRHSRLGQGGFAVVHLEKAGFASQSAPDLRAVKELNFTQSGGGGLKRQYIRELNALVKFSQPKFVRSFLEFYGWFESEGLLFIATEYCEFGDLKQLVLRLGHLQEPDAQVIVSQVLQGIISMHDNHFAHRDLKPANILVKRMPPFHDWHVKIGDMGLSKRIGMENTSTTVRGTPGFTAPERTPGLGQNPTGVDPFPCDIWCLGEISFFLLTKKSTFDNLMVLQQYYEDSVSFPQERLDGVNASAPAKDFIRRLMAAQPSERPSATEADTHVWMDALNDTTDLVRRWISGASIEQQSTYSRMRGVRTDIIDRGSVTLPSASWDTARQTTAQTLLGLPKGMTAAGISRANSMPPLPCAPTPPTVGRGSVGDEENSRDRFESPVPSLSGHLPEPSRADKRRAQMTSAALDHIRRSRSTMGDSLHLEDTGSRSWEASYYSGRNSPEVRQQYLPRARSRSNASDEDGLAYGELHVFPENDSPSVTQRYLPRGHRSDWSDEDDPAYRGRQSSMGRRQSAEEEARSRRSDRLSIPRIFKEGSSKS